MFNLFVVPDCECTISPSFQVEHVLEPQSDGLVELRSLPESGAQAEAREAKRNGKVWRVDRVQVGWTLDYCKSAWLFRKQPLQSKILRRRKAWGYRYNWIIIWNSWKSFLQVHTIPAPLSISMDSIDDIERSIDDAFDEALSPRGRVIEVVNIFLFFRKNNEYSKIKDHFPPSDPSYSLIFDCSCRSSSSWRTWKWDVSPSGVFDRDTRSELEGW